MEHKKNSVAAVKIQTQYRGYRQRKKYQDLKAQKLTDKVNQKQQEKLLRQKHVSATKIQVFFPST